MRSVRLHRVVLAAALLVPGLLFVAAVCQNREDVLREGRDAIGRTAAVMQEHTRKVFETAELAIGEVDERTGDEDWATIGSPATVEFLRRIKAPMDQLISLWIADRDGVIRAGTQPWPAGSGIAGREFFQAAKAGVMKEGAGGMYVGVPFTGVATTVTSFAIVRRRTVPGGGFDGTIHVAVSPGYFARFYAEAAPPSRHEAMLVRSDGVVLAWDPAPGAPKAVAADSALMREIGLGAGNGMLQGVASDGVEWEYAFRKVGAYPMYVVFAVKHSVLLARWYRNLRIYGAVAGAAALTLLLVSWLALRGARAEQAALGLLRAEIRQRKGVEQQLAHAQRMEAVGQLTGGVAHDFNNLLTAILGNLELIQRAAAAPDGRARIERLAGTAIKAVQRGASLTKSLLAFSRKQPLQPRALDTNALLVEFLDLVRQGVGSRVAVTFEPGRAVPACVADPVALEAAVLNLALNARDAMPGGGWLRFRTGTAVLSTVELVGNSEARPGRFVSIEVADGGEGMTAEVATKAFEPFFTTKPIGQGTGLGLSQVYGFVRQLGGHVTLVSAPGAGTAITLYLPVALQVHLPAAMRAGVPAGTQSVDATAI